MKNSDKQWLNAVPWDSVLLLNKSLCQAQKLDPLTNAKGYDKAERLWQGAVRKTMNLRDALDLCHEAFDLGPFTFNNGNTFAAIGRTLIEEPLKMMPPVEAQIIRTTVCHYIAGLIGRKELLQVLRHFEEMLDAAPPSDSARSEASAVHSVAPSGQRVTV